MQRKRIGPKDPKGKLGHAANAAVPLFAAYVDRPVTTDAERGRPLEGKADRRRVGGPTPEGERIGSAHGNQQLFDGISKKNHRKEGCTLLAIMGKGDDEFGERFGGRRTGEFGLREEIAETGNQVATEGQRRNSAHGGDASAEACRLPVAFRRNDSRR